jgi:hypothetical protein
MPEETVDVIVKGILKTPRVRENIPFPIESSLVFSRSAMLNLSRDWEMASYFSAETSR